MDSCGRLGNQPEKEMEPAAAAATVESPDPPLSPPPEGPPSEDTSSSSTVSPATHAPAPAPRGAREVAAAMEAVERDAAAIAESYASLFSSLRVALSNVRVLPSRPRTRSSLRALFFAALLLVLLPLTDGVFGEYYRRKTKVTSTSVENMDCLGDVVGRLQESALEASSKGNKYINSCLRLNEEMRGLESLAMQLKILRKNVDSLDLAVNQLLRLP